MNNLVNGKRIFQIMDTHGLPLDIINDILREKGMAFNVVEFVEAALESTNFTYPTIKRRLITSMIWDGKVRDSFEQHLDKVASIKGWVG